MTYNQWCECLWCKPATTLLYCVTERRRDNSTLRHWKLRNLGQASVSWVLDTSPRVCVLGICVLRVYTTGAHTNAWIPRMLMRLCSCVLLHPWASGGGISLPCALGSCHLLFQWEKECLALCPIHDLTQFLSHHNVRATGNSQCQPEEGDTLNTSCTGVSAEFHYFLMFLYSMWKYLSWQFTCSSQS